MKDDVFIDIVDPQSLNKNLFASATQTEETKSFTNKHIYDLLCKIVSSREDKDTKSYLSIQYDLLKEIQARFQNDLFGEYSLLVMQELNNLYRYDPKLRNLVDTRKK